MAKKKAKKLTQAQKRELTQRETAKLARRTGPFTAGMVEAGRQTKALLGSVGIGKGVKAGDRTALNQLRKQRPVSTFAGSLLPTAAIPGGILGKGIAARLGVTSGKGAASRANPEKINLGRAIKRGSQARQKAHAATAERVKQKRIAEGLKQAQKAGAVKKKPELPGPVHPRKAKAQKVKQATLGQTVGDAFVKSGGAELGQRTLVIEARREKDRRRKKKKVAKAVAKATGKIKSRTKPLQRRSELLSHKTTARKGYYVQHALEHPH
jgi:hypothetical protein